MQVEPLYTGRATKVQKCPEVIVEFEQNLGLNLGAALPTVTLALRLISPFSAPSFL